jgi:hypothetical protein
VLHLYGCRVSDEDARNLAAALIADGTPHAVHAAGQIGYALELDRVMAGLSPDQRDAVLSVLEDPPSGLAELRGALERDHAHRFDVQPR